MGGISSLQCLGQALEDKPADSRRALHDQGAGGLRIDAMQRVAVLAANEALEPLLCVVQGAGDADATARARTLP